MSNKSKITSFYYLCNISRKKGGVNMIFCTNTNIKVSYKLVVTFLLFIARHGLSTQKSKFVISLQYLKKKKKKRKKGMELIFYMQIDIKLSYKLMPLILVGMARPNQITQNNKFGKSLQYLKKEVGDEADFLCDGYDSF